MAKQVKKEQIFKFEEDQVLKGAYSVDSVSGKVHQGHIAPNKTFKPANGRAFDLDALNEIAEFIKGLDKGE